MGDTPVTLPSDINAEQATIGSVFIQPDAYYEISQFLTAGNFYLVRHQRIWAAFDFLCSMNIPIDFLTVNNQLDKSGMLEDIGGASYLTLLLTCVPTSINAVPYAKIVKEKYIRRKLIEDANKIVTSAYDGTIDVADVISGAAGAVQKTAEEMSFGDGSMKSIRQLASEHYQLTSEMVAHPDAGIGLDTGLIDLNKQLGGSLKKKFILLAGRPGVGKTSLALQIAITVARKMKTVMIFSLDMDDAAQLTNILISIMTGINNQLLEVGKITPEEREKYRSALDEIATLPLFIDDTMPMTIPSIRAKCLTIKATKGLDLVVIDYLMLIDGYGSREENDRANLMTRDLKLLKKELDVPLIVIHHMNRAIEKRSEGEPILSDLNEGGEKDPDIVMFVYEPKDSFEVGKYDRRKISFAKHRGGAKGKIELLFDGPCTTFRNMARQK
jgi:replicative DNA helicase